MNIRFNGNILYTILVKMPHITFQFVCIPRLVDQACRGCRCIVLGAGASRPGFGRFVPLLLGWLRREAESAVWGAPCGQIQLAFPCPFF